MAATVSNVPTMIIVHSRNKLCEFRFLNMSIVSAPAVAHNAECGIPVIKVEMANRDQAISVIASP